MKRKKLIAISALAFTITLGGSAYLTGQAGAAAASTTSGTQASTAAHDNSDFGKGKDGARGGFFKLDQAGLASLLGLSEDDLKTAQQDGKSLAAIASEQDVDVQDVIDWVEAQLTSNLKQQLTDGKITQTQYDDQAADLAARAEDFVNNTFTGKDGQGMGGQHGGFAMMDQSGLASLLGLSEDDLKTAQQDGKSLAAIASEQGVDEQDVIDWTEAQLTSNLKQQLTDGKITQTQYDDQAANLATRAEDFVNNTHSGKGGPTDGRHQPADQTAAADSSSN
ncbi:hypothetical protein [Paenibacillus pinistramenti]|uniref:hypothetical protein n=1 Tax=Paenibacillus pinistramenti TaxID=1768003 RepID=UPI00110844D1|nr:hypothetical protein [Paenibacillus pinistramenti]